MNDSIDLKDIEDELSFWRNELSSFSRNPSSNPFTSFKLNKNSLIQRDIESRLLTTQIIEKKVDILDIGCGPFSTIGKISSNFTISLYAVDPLAEHYSKLCTELNIVQPHKIVNGVGEFVDQYFEAKSFNYIHMENSLDHCFDPKLVISSVHKILKINGIVYCRVFKNEGQHNMYGGFHKWNFDIYDKQIVFWNPYEIHFLSEYLNEPTKSWSDTIYFNDQSKQRELIFFESQKIESETLEKVTGTLVRAKLVRDFECLVLERTAQFSGQFFCHGYDINNELVWNSSFEWVSEVDRKCIYPKNFSKINSYKVGLFEVNYKNDNSKDYQDIWSGFMSV